MLQIVPIQELGFPCQLVPDSIPVYEMHLLNFFKVSKKPSRFRRVAFVLLQLSNEFALTGNMVLTEGDVSLGLSKMLLEHCPVHTA